MNCRSLALMVLLIATVPALADEFLMMEMPAGSPAAHSMLLWPPNLSVPDQAHFLFDAQGPAAQPYRVRALWDFWGCEPEGPAAGIDLQYLIGRSSSPHLAFAEPAGLVTGVTDAVGMTTVVLPLRGGGHGTAGDFALAAPDVFCAINLDAGLMVNSPDLTGDLLVNLADLTLFAQDYFGPYNYRSDLRWDGQINLSDMWYFVVAMQGNR